MKAKIYPINTLNHEISAIASAFNLHLEIICASLANGISTIKNIIDSQEIKTTINWCKTIGATIKRNGDSLVIKGVNNNIKYTHSLFKCGNNSLTAKMMLPLLCTIHQPFGIEAENNNVLEEIKEYKSIFEEYGAIVVFENNMIRFENKLTAKECEFDGNIDIALAAGFLIAFPLISGQSILKLRAPVRDEKTYEAILKILRKFHIDIKHPATMRYEVMGIQKYRKCKIKTEIDNLYLSCISLLSQKLPNDDSYIYINNYSKDASSESAILFDFVKKNVVNLNRHFFNIVLKKKKISVHKVELKAENSLPLLMVIGVLNEYDYVIGKVDLNNKQVAKQFDIMSKIFTKLNLEFAAIDNTIIIHPGKVIFKKQVDCEKDPHVAMALSLLALLSNEPIIIYNADCIYDIYLDFFNDLKKYGAKIEFIND